MQVKYFPSIDEGRTIRSFACAVLLPDAYPAAAGTKWPWEMAVHGMGELSQGALANLKNLVEGFDYNGDGIREGAAFVTADMKRAVDAHGKIIVVPTYANFFEPDQINRVYDHMVANYSVRDKFMYTGFSLGGGAGIKYATSNETNARRLEYLVLCAPTYNMGDKTLPGKVGLPVHCFHNRGDKRVPASNSRSIVADINASNPGVKAVMTIFAVDSFPGNDAHGCNVEVWAMTPPKAPGGEGLINSIETVYQVHDGIIANGPRQMKTGSTTGGTTVEPTPTPSPVSVIPKADYTIDGYKIHLIGDKSTGFTQGYDGKWEFVSGPSGVASQQVFPGGSTYINADGVLPKPGDYKFRFILKGAPSPIEIVVSYGTTEKTISSFNSTTDLITWSDGTTEKAEAIYSAGKWSIKTAAGKIITV